MYIFGAILFMVLPYMAGYSCKSIFRWKETNQIETYLIGFFFLFFLQAVVFIPFVWLGKSLSDAVDVLYILALSLVVLFVLCMGIHVIGGRKKGTEPVVKQPWRKTDRACFFMMLMVFLLVLLRMALGVNLLREDIVLETVLTTIQSDSLYVTHPLTGQVMEAGMISSKKILTSPLFYAGVVRMTGVDAETFLYFVMGVMTLLCSYYASALLFSQVSSNTRSKRYVFGIIMGLLILSGDYHSGLISYKLLYQGYEGNTICFAVILPYLLYLIVSWYRKESEEEKNTFGIRFMYLTKIVMAFAVSVLMTSLGCGLVFLFMAMVIAGICCLLKSIKEVRACRES